MKLKKLIYLVGFLTLFSCSDFLDVVPDNVATLDHAFADRITTERFLFTCYNSLPNHHSNSDNPAFFASGEFLCLNSGYLWNNNWEDQIVPPYRVLSGEQNTNDPIINYWDGSRQGKNMFVGIRNCNIFLENIDKPIDLTETEKNRWISEVKFLKAYYHFWLFQMYGPIPLMKENLPVSASPEEVKVYRDPVEDVVNYIVQLIDEAVPNLPSSIGDPLNEMGRITQPAALAIKAKVLALAASPLFNGNENYNGLKDKRGIELFPATYDKEKWKLAADATLEAIQSAEENGHKLYYHRSNRLLNDTTMMKLNIRGSVTDNYNEEIIWAATPDPSHLQKSSVPAFHADFSNAANSEMAATLAVAEQFYSKNGVPINEDIFYDYANRYKTRVARADERFLVGEKETTAILNFDREMRFYASLAFDRGIIYGIGNLEDTPPTQYVRARRYEMSGQRANECFSVTGYFPKKLVHWESSYSSSTNFSTKLYHFPIVRLADMYLLYAEAVTEYNDDVLPEVYEYIDAVRKRASLDGVVNSWANYSSNPDKPKNRTGLLSIIHQERLIELAFEGQRFWDMRRWRTLEDYLNKPLQGWSVSGETIDEYYQVRTVLESSFGRKDYLWPIKQSSIDQNTNLEQNPGW